MMKNSGIEILLSSDCDYEKLVAEIYYDGKFIALLNQDEGPEKLKIEFPGKEVQEEMVWRKIDLDIFTKGLEMAKKKLKG
ncbi:MAG: hypothetical protein WBO24_08160 [Nitrospirales bacterium]|jgi:hypothetical protein|nr:hypothetical protein [Nitrospira sp.]